MHAVERLDRPRWGPVSFRRIADQRGDLTVIESSLDIEFDIARVYYLYNVPVAAERAGHAHRALDQVYLALNGSFDVHLDDGSVRETVTLNRPDQGLYIRPGVWRTIDNFVESSVCFVLASALYNEDDYIRSYDDFQAYLRRKQVE